MATYGCKIAWTRGDAVFTDNRYSRAHAWNFDGGAVVRGSSSPHSVKSPMSDPAAVDPEEALVAAVSSCHMLWFLSLAAAGGYVVDSYSDAAEARMGDFGGGRMGLTEVLLQPAVVLSGSRQADDAAIDALHRAAHERCYVANSIRGDVRVAGRWSHAAD